MRAHGRSRPRNRLIRMAGPRSVLGASMPGSLATLVPRHIALQPALDPGCCLSHDDSIHWYNSHLGNLEIGAEQAASRRSRPFDRNRDEDGLQESRGGRCAEPAREVPWTPQRMGRREGQGGSGGGPARSRRGPENQVPTASPKCLEENFALAH
jgi:hypothetical protein